MLSIKNVLKIIKEYGYTQLSDSDGSCACGAFNIGGIHIRTHCHRSGNCCPYGGVHLWVDNDYSFSTESLKMVGDYLAKKLSKDYMMECTVKITTEEKERELGY